MKERQKLCGYITQEILTAFVKGKLPSADEADVLAHIAQCDDCAEHLAQIMEQEIQVMPPIDLCSQIMEQTVGQKGIDTGRRRRSIRSNWQSFFGYTARVACGVAVALVIIFYMPTDLSASRGDMYKQYTEERLELARQRELESEKRREVESSKREEKAAGNTSTVSAWLNKMSGAIGDNLSSIFMKEEEE